MPNFLIIGAAKTGTTSLYHYLKQHPEIYMSPVKEPKFFAYDCEKPDFRGPGDQARKPKFTNLEAYQSLFVGVSNETAIGEASVIYLYNPKTPERIRHYIPDVKLIAVLRDPVERAYSNFWVQMAVRRDEPLTDFAQAMRAEEKRIINHWHPRWHYKQRGFYYVQLKRYFDNFERNQIKIYLFDELVTNSNAVVRDIFRFLDVDGAFMFDVTTRHNVTRGVPNSKAMHELLSNQYPIKNVIKRFLPDRLRQHIIKAIKTYNFSPRPPLTPEVHGQLIEEYRNDILRLQDLIQRDLSKWLE
jgi:hypothetical protein